MIVAAPIRADIEALFDGDRPGARSWWVALWTGICWRVVFDPPSAAPPEVGR